MLTNVPNSGTVEKRTYSASDDQEGAVRPVQDAMFTYPLSLRLLPGFLMATGTILYWRWYEQFVTGDKFRRYNLAIIRLHSVIFSLVLAAMISILVELYFHRRKNASKGYTVLGHKGCQDQEESVVEMTTSSGMENRETVVPMKAKTNVFESKNNCESTTNSISRSASLMGSGRSLNNVKSTSTIFSQLV